MWKFKSWKGRDKWLFLLTMGIILCILAFPVGNGVKTAEAGSGRGREQTDGLSTADGTAGASIADASIAGVADMGIPAAVPVSGSSYESRLEARVKEILSHVDGVGKVDVMIVLKSSGEKVIHTDGSSSRSVTEETDSGGGSRRIESEEENDSAVLSSADGASSPIIEKELLPEVSGVIISASGGGSPQVRAEISSAMEALFGLPAHKIKVMKRVE